MSARLRLPLATPFHKFQRCVLYSSSSLAISAGIYNVLSHFTQTPEVHTPSNYQNIISSSSASRSQKCHFTQHTIPSGKVGVVPKYQQHDSSSTSIDHMVTAVHGHGEVHYTSNRANDAIIFGNDNIILHEPQVLSQPLRRGKSVMIPGNHWHQIVNHGSEDLVITVTNVPQSNV